jgi:Tfp pilus assembly protein PilP
MLKSKQERLLLVPEDTFLENIRLCFTIGKDIETSGFIKADNEVVHVLVGTEKRNDKGKPFSKISAVIEAPFHYLVSISYRRNDNGEETMIKMEDLMRCKN